MSPVNFRFLNADEFLKKIVQQINATSVHPKVFNEFKSYLEHEKILQFSDQWVVNTHFPPYPGRAFDRFIGSMSGLDQGTDETRLFSVTWAVTNQCNYRCWHCYNAGREELDVPLNRMKEIAEEIQNLGAAVVTLTGGEPLLRKDLEEIARAFDDRTSLIIGTTGDGLTLDRAKRLRRSGVFAAGFSLDSIDESIHDRLRGKKGAFKTALTGLRISSEAGLYPYIVAVATREFLEESHFMKFMRFAGQSGALEVHLLEPSPSGRLAGHPEVMLDRNEKNKIIEYQKTISRSLDLPILSCFAYLESPEHFGCGAGLTHIYIDGSGKVCPCNLVPLSFGDISDTPLKTSLDRMGMFFKKPRTLCVGHILSNKIPDVSLPTAPDISESVCKSHLPQHHSIPGFFRILDEARSLSVSTGSDLASAYNRIHQHYEEYWLSQAGGPILELFSRLDLQGSERIVEAGCGTGYATLQIAQRLKNKGSLISLDISEGMIKEARIRLQHHPGVTFKQADALEELKTYSGLDLVVSTWVLGYIPLNPFFFAASQALKSDGRLAFIVHKENSPRIPLQIFAELAMEDPSVMIKRISFDFPRDQHQLTSQLEQSGFRVKELFENSIRFVYSNPEETLQHLLKSGAGTAYYDALDPVKRIPLERKFIEIMSEKARSEDGYEVIHDYFSCIAEKLSNQ